MTKSYYQLALETIQALAEAPGVSGYEQSLLPAVLQRLGPFADESYTDFMGSCYFAKNGSGSGQTIMLAAHLDEIGLIVTHIDSRGFVHFAPVGGVDERTLLYQEVLIHGRKEIKGIVSFLTDPTNNNKRRSIRPANMAIDTGYPVEKVQQWVNPGDIISIIRQPFEMLNQTIAGKALDDRVGIAVLAVCLCELNRIKHHHQVVAVATVQEEIGLRGGQTSANRLKPDLAVIIDVTHAQTLDSKNQVSIHLGKGPAITIGPNIHPRIYSQFSTTAQDNNLAIQIQPNPGPTGTDARIIQLCSYGIPTGLLSIPLRYMHTSVETVSLKDVVNCGKLLARFIAALPDDLEEIACY